MKCPNCGNEQHDGLTECQKCGVIFAKWEERQKKIDSTGYQSSAVSSPPSNVFSRSWEITKLSFGVIKDDKELLLFPFLAGIFSMLFMASMILPTYFSLILIGAIQKLKIEHFEYIIPILLFLLYLLYLGISFIVIFFNVCLVHTAKVRFEGGNATFRESINFALSKRGLIFSWSRISAIVGLFFTAIEIIAQKSGRVGKTTLNHFATFLQIAWSIVVIFVVPCMVYHNLGPMDALKKSADVLRKTWGDNIIKHIGLGLMEILFIFAGIVLVIPLLAIFTAAFGSLGIIASIIIAVIYFVSIILVFNVANTIFSTALYVYAETGRVPREFSEGVMRNAFKSSGSNITPGGII